MKILIFVIALIMSSRSSAQCACCYTHILYDQNELVDYFSSKSIKNESFNSVTIMESELSNTGKTINETILAVVEFDKKGNYNKYIGFYNGTYNHRIDYKRNSFGKILSSRMFYLDSVGNVLEGFGLMPTRDYKSSCRKFEIQDRNYKNEKVPSSESTIQVRNYDFKGRIKYSLSQMHFEDAIQVHHSEHVMKTEFYKKELIGIRTHTYQDTINGIDTIFYNEKWKMVKMKSYYPQSDYLTHYYSGQWEYDSNGNRILYKSVNPTGMPNSECPDQNDFELKYIYNDDNLLQSVTYTYSGKTYQVKCQYE